MSDTSNNAAYKAEDQRQTDILANAFREAIQKCGQEFEAPILNAVCGALVSVLAEIINQVPPGRRRNALRDAVDRNLRAQIEEERTL